jgi:hypothetical protein
MAENRNPDKPHGGWPQTVENLGCALLLAVVLVALIVGCVYGLTNGGA